MKKNILVVQSLFLFPLLTSSFSLGMEKKLTYPQRQQMKKLTPRQRKEQQANKKQYQKLNYKEVAIKALSDEEKKVFLNEKEKEARRNNGDLLEELKQSKLFMSKQLIFPISGIIVTPPVNTIAGTASLDTASENDDYEVFPFFASHLNSTHDDASTTSTESSATSSVGIEIKETPNQLAASVMLPTEKKGLGFGGTLAYYTSRNSLLTFIIYLTKGTFDTENADYFEWFNQAIVKGTEDKAFNVLMTVAALCQQKEQYKNSIRISDDAAAKAFSFLETHYSTEINDLNKKLEEKQRESILQYNQRTIAFAKCITDAVDSYHKDVQQIANTYNAETTKATDNSALTQKQILTFSALNASTRAKIKEMLDQHSLTIPGNECANHIKNENITLEKLLKRSNQLTTITEPQDRLHNSLALTNK